MNSRILPEVEARVSVQPGILCLLRNAHRQLEALAGMVQSDAGCQEVLGKLCEVHDALSSVVDRLVADHLEYCFAASFQTLSPARQRQALTEIVSLYALVSRQAAQIIRKEVSFTGGYPPVAQVGGTVWVGLLSLIVSMPLVTSRVKRQMKSSSS